MIRLRVTTVACFIAMTSLPVYAGLFDDDEARKQIVEVRKQSSEQANQIANRIDKLERGQIDLANQLEAARNENAKLRGQLEVMTNELEQANKRQKDLYVDMDSRLRKLESAAPSASSAAPTSSASSPSAPPSPPAGGDAAAETRAYEAGLAQFKAANHMGAVVTFGDFIKAYPGSRYLPNAHYWMANAYVQLRNYDKASEQFNKVINSYPDDQNAPDSLLGLASAQDEAGNASAARKTLDTLVSRYPTSPAAQIAKRRLAQRR